MPAKIRKSDVPLLAPRTCARINLGPHDAHLESVQPMPGSDDLIVTSFKGVWTVDARTGSAKRWYRQNAMMEQSVCWEAAVSADGSVVAAAFGALELLAWHGAQQVGPVDTRPGIFTRLSVTTDGKTLAGTRLMKQLVVYDARTLVQRWMVDLKKSFANGARIDPTGEIVAAAGTDGAVRVFDAKDGTPRGVFAGNGWADDLDVRAGLIAIGGRGKEVWIYDSAGALVRVLPFGRNVQRLSLSYDGKRCIASGGSRTAAMIWDVDSGTAIARIDPGEGVNTARFSCVKQGGTGYLLAGTANQGEVLTWEVA